MLQSFSQLFLKLRFCSLELQKLKITFLIGEPAYDFEELDLEGENDDMDEDSYVAQDDAVYVFRKHNGMFSSIMHSSIISL